MGWRDEGKIEESEFERFNEPGFRVCSIVFAIVDRQCAVEFDGSPGRNCGCCIFGTFIRDSTSGRSFAGDGVV